jgi:hypothetical protein
MPLQTVHLRINDAATGRPTPVRLRVTDAAGIYYAPFGRPADLAQVAKSSFGGNLLLDDICWTYIDGTCEIALPPGDLTVEARKGPEYRPLRQVVHLPAGKIALRFAVERWTDLRAEGWHSGDARAHHLTPHAALLEAAAEDLAVVNLLANRAAVDQCHNKCSEYPNLLAFSGQRPCLERDGHQVVVNTHNTHPKLGNLALLHCHRVVFPLTFGGQEGTDDWSLSVWCDQCHRKRGLVVWTDADIQWMCYGGEALAGLILGKVDALELTSHLSGQLRSWHVLLNAGFRVPLVGASRKTGIDTPLGCLRTYARLADGEAYSYTGWIDAIRAGRTFVTAGPILRFTVNGHGPGAVLYLPADAPPLRLQVSSASTHPIECVEVIANGQVVGSGRESVEVDVLPADGGWLAARCWGSGHKTLLAQASSVYIRVAGRTPPVDSAAVTSILWSLESCLTWIECAGRFSNPKSRDHLLSIFDAARQTLLARLGASGTNDTPAPPA